jgi:hypothetical protein
MIWSRAGHSSHLIRINGYAVHNAVGVRGCIWDIIVD